MIGVIAKAKMKTVLKESEKMPTLVLTLIRAAAEQGASITEFEDACEVAMEILSGRLRSRAVFSPDDWENEMLPLREELLRI